VAEGRGQRGGDRDGRIGRIERVEHGAALDASADLASLRGVGAKRAEALAGAGLKTVGDLLWGLPYRYIDRGSIVPIGDVSFRDLGPGGAATFMGTIAEVRQSTTPVQRMALTEALLDDGTGAMRLVWFNQPHMSRALRRGEKIIVWGQPLAGRHGPEMHSPSWEGIGGTMGGTAPDALGPRAAPDTTGPRTEPGALPVRRFLPLYRRIGPLTGKARQGLVALALGQVRAEEPFLPPGLSEGLPDTITALRLLHGPPDDFSAAELEAGTTPAHRRLALEELFAFALAIELRRSGASARTAEPVPTSPELREKLKAMLPFRLTGAQRRAFREIVEDLRSGRVMHRMLQGDVGSGKTLVAFLTMAMAAETGGQAALLAPTEVLARQHAAALAGLLGGGKGLGEMQLLVGGMKAAERRGALERIADGRAGYVIGTHALFQETVDFANLQLVVVDEQHRFGVRQREAIKEKGMDPHWLVMSATPIPRSLALAIFGDLDQSVLDELPPGRQPICTILLEPSEAERAWAILEREISQGRQAFVVSPAIEAMGATDQADLGKGAKISLRDIKAMEALLRARLPGAAIAVAHGRLKPDSLNARMQEFASGAAQILLATTVIEVGVDVPNATAMVVDHAERFGLGQLHQLRGRVGRGAHGGRFVMISGSETERLRTLVETSDGFRIAQRDLEIRGPGEFFGTRQSGLPRFQVADLVRDRRELAMCREEAAKAVARGLTAGQTLWLEREGGRIGLAEVG
jgi:ATP-dependent DNA helicase RecG